MTKTASTPSAEVMNRLSQAVDPARSPRKRAQRLRYIQYGLLIAAAVLLGLAIDWEAIGQNFFRADMIVASGNGLLNALKNTVVYTIGAFTFGLILGTLLAVMKLSKIAVNRWIAIVYIEIFRGLPALLVLAVCGLIGLAIPNFRFPGGDVGTVWFGLGLVAAAYMAETIRAGILGVPKGQTEAARSLGMSSTQALSKIVLPQAFRLTLPPLTNELILLVKDSSLVFVLGLTVSSFELTKHGMELANSTTNLTPFVVSGIAYLTITLPLSFVVQRMESSRKAR